MNIHKATLLADIPTMFVIGLVITLLFHLARRDSVMTKAGKDAFERAIHRVVLGATIAFVVFVEIATYFNAPYAIWMMRHWPINEMAMSGTEFMWNGYFHWPFPRACAALAFGAESVAGFCATLEPTTDPFDWWPWWPIALLCFAAQYVVARCGVFLGLTAFHNIIKSNVSRPRPGSKPR